VRTASRQHELLIDISRLSLESERRAVVGVIPVVDHL
jgi:hypothetical protein